ncbi:putative copper resistance protein D [Salsuginibacillus halophilus]|uniref:Putative copper resistance protein D n=1 Tax=Salsuginibacillus halophilus TaxID=517424 RepID=A0A2P8HXN8_9BACI|nr:CopD family protein [Salsuginibacillus halophilus]PSL50992.1 putative copper resistance protein D [Salsuginibacillus halophilus]
MAVIDAFLFIALALIVGIVILRHVPPKARPDLSIPRWFIPLLFVCVTALAAVPYLQQVLSIVNMFNAPVVSTAFTVLIDYRSGQGLLAVFAGMILYLISRLLLRSWCLGILQTIALVFVIFGVAWMSHAASLDRFGGFIADALHLSGASVWAGVVFVGAFFFSGEKGWRAFALWFHYVALGAVLSLLVTGLILMQYIVPEYQNSWLLPYGQLLLIKHLLFLPLIFYGFFHGFLLKQKWKKDPGFVPRRSFQLEAVLLFVVFFVTGIMAEQTPPHEVVQTIQFEAPALFATMWIGDAILPGSYVAWEVTMLAVLFIVACFGVSLLMFWSLYQSRLKIAPLLFSAMIVISGYGAVITGASTVEGSGAEEMFSTVSEAVKKPFPKTTEVELLQVKPYGENYKAAIYTLDGESLIAELFLETEEAYMRLPDARLTIGGTPVEHSDTKIRTFLIEDGVWQQTGANYTYITLGYIQEPENTAEVHVFYEDERHEVEMKNNSFFTYATSENRWNENHPFEFYNAQGEEIGGYMRTMMEEGAFCH